MLRKLLFFFLVFTSFQVDVSAQIDVFFESRVGTIPNTVEVDVKVNNFNDIVLFQFSINYDSLLLQYNSVTNLTSELTEPSTPNISTFLPANVGVPTAMNLGIDPGELTVSWSNNSTEPDSAPDGTTLFTVIFDGVAMPCSMTALMVTDTPRVIEAFDSAGFPTVDIGVVGTPTNIQVPGPDCGGPTGGDGCPIEGDINGVGVILEEITGETNTNVCLELTVDNWSDIQSGQFSLSWDPSILTFTGTGNYGLGTINAGSFNIANASTGGITFNYLDGANPSTLSDGTILFEICFDVIGADGQFTDILFGENLSVEFSNSNDQTLPFYTDCGEVTVGDSTKPMPDGCPMTGDINDLGVVIQDDVVAVGDNFCIPVTADNWADIVTAQFGVSWDPSVIMFTGIQNQNPSIPELNGGAFNLDDAASGQLSVVYTDAEGGASPANADGDVLFEMCFTVVGMPCDFTDVIIGTVTINGIPLAPEFSNNSGEIPFYTDCGEIVISDTEEDPLTFNMASGSVTQGGEVCLDVTAIQFQDVISAQFAINWDPALLTYDRIDCLNSDINVLANDFMTLGNDIVRFSYSETTPQNLDDNEVLFCICFTGNCGPNPATVDITSDGAFIVEVANSNNQPITPVITNAGMVDIDPCGAGPVITIVSNNGAPCNGSLGFVNTSISPSNSTCVWTQGTTVVSMDCDPMLPAGVYTLTATDMNNMTATSQITITEPAPIVVSVSVTNAMCDQLGSASVSTTGGVTPLSYAWSVGGCGDSPMCTGINPGVYSVIVTDNDGCTSSSAFEINQDAINFTVTENVTNINCGGPGMISLVITGSNNPTTVFSPDIGNGMNVAAGNYAYTVTDNDTGCTLSDMVMVEDDIDVISCNGAVTDISCNGDASGSISLQISGGCAAEGYNINYLPPNGSIDGNIISGLIAGMYSVTVTDDNGSTCVNSFDLTEPAAISIMDTTIGESTGQDGSISVAISGGTMPYSYAWSGPTMNLPDSDNITGLAPGDYSLVVTDDNGCIFTLDTPINVPDASVEPTLSNVNVISEADNNGFGVSCSGLPANLCDGEVNATVSGVGMEPVTITITPDGGSPISTTSFPITGLCAGTYTLEVLVGTTSLTEQVIITEPDPISISFDVTDASGPTNSDGAIDLIVVNGVGALSYDWTGPSCPCADEEDLTDLLPGSYSVFVTDDNGCTGLENIIVNGNSTDVPCHLGSPIITPNGDNVNDTFEISCSSENENSLQVFDRWGRLVHDAVDYTGGWNGVDKDGIELTEGAYYWVLSVTFNNGDNRLFRGSVTLLRQ